MEVISYINSGKLGLSLSKNLVAFYQIWGSFEFKDISKNYKISYLEHFIGYYTQLFNNSINSAEILFYLGFSLSILKRHLK